DVIDLAGLDGTGPRRDDARQVIRVYGADQRPVLQLFLGPAEILEDLPVEEFHLAHRALGGDQARNVVDDLSPGNLIRAQRLLAAFAILDIEVRSEPSGDVPLRIAQGIGAKQEPSIRAVVTAHSRFDVSGSSGGHT